MNRIQNPKINPHIDSDEQLLTRVPTRCVSVQKHSLVTSILKKLDIHTQKNKNRSLSYTVHKNYIKLTQNGSKT